MHVPPVYREPSLASEIVRPNLTHEVTPCVATRSSFSPSALPPSWLAPAPTRSHRLRRKEIAEHRPAVRSAWQTVAEPTARGNLRPDLL